MDGWGMYTDRRTRPYTQATRVGTAAHCRENTRTPAITYREHEGNEEGLDLDTVSKLAQHVHLVGQGRKWGAAGVREQGQDDTQLTGLTAKHSVGTGYTRRHG